MGYTHYYKPTRFNKEQWEQYRSTCALLAAELPEKSDTAGGFYSNTPIEIVGPHSAQLDSKPIFDNKMVAFNGKGENGCETFVVFASPKKNQGWTTFCKTSRMPYDLLVVACLIAAWQILDFRFKSDAFNCDETCPDLQEGIDYYNKVVKPTVPITVDMVVKQRRDIREKD